MDLEKEIENLEIEGPLNKSPIKMITQKTFKINKRKPIIGNIDLASSPLLNKKVTLTVRSNNQNLTDCKT